MMEEYIDDCGRDHHILITHFRSTVGEYVKEEIDSAKLCKPYCLVIAGDIHKQHQADNLVYCNQPINSQFASKAETSYLLLEIDNGAIHYDWVPTKLPSLIQWNRDAADFDKVCSDAEEHWKKNREDMGEGNVDFLKINLTGTLKELRKISADAENVKINKIPIVEESFITEMPQNEVLSQMDMDMQLIEYLKTVPYSEDNIYALLEIWKEVV